MADDGFVKVESKSKKRTAEEMENDEMEVASEAPVWTPLPPLSGNQTGVLRREMRKIWVPGNRYTPLKENWKRILAPLVEHLRLRVRFNLRTRNVELTTFEETKDIGSLQKGADFVKAFTLGFAVEDALALCRLDDLYLESFDVTDVKPLKGDHLARAIGRIAGQAGKMRFAIENQTKTRIVLADSKVHLLGSYQNIRTARRNISSLIMGTKLTTVTGRMSNAMRKFPDN